MSCTIAQCPAMLHSIDLKALNTDLSSSSGQCGHFCSTVYCTSCDHEALHALLKLPDRCSLLA